LIECVYTGVGMDGGAGAVRWFDTATTSIFMGEVNEQALWYWKVLNADFTSSYRCSLFQNRVVK